MNATWFKRKLRHLLWNWKHDTKFLDKYFVQETAIHFRVSFVYFGSLPPQVQYINTQTYNWPSIWWNLKSFQGKVYFVNKDRRCIVQEKSNGETQTTLHYHTSSLYPPRRESCCLKFINCIRGSAEYRDMKQRTNVHARDGINSVSRIDKASRIFFPFVFIAFNVFYWITYLDIGKDGNVLIWVLCKFTKQYIVLNFYFPSSHFIIYK